jgi:hypothetical protein
LNTSFSRQLTVLGPSRKSRVPALVNKRYWLDLAQFNSLLLGRVPEPTSALVLLSMRSLLISLD